MPQATYLRDFLSLKLENCQNDFSLKMLSVIIQSYRYYPAVLHMKQQEHKRITLNGPFVLVKLFASFRTILKDRDQTASRRSKPNSRNALFGEQPNPWNQLQLQVALSRHRGAKRFFRCELLKNISLLSLEYFLFVK